VIFAASFRVMPLHSRQRLNSVFMDKNMKRKSIILAVLIALGLGAAFVASAVGVRITPAAAGTNGS
jgi:hypothetical protein